MYNSRYTQRPPSEASEASNHQNLTHRLRSPAQSDYEYLGRLVTRERLINRKSKSIQQNLSFPQNTNKYHHSMRSHRQDNYKEVIDSSSDGDSDDPDDLNKPLGVIRISDRHYREIYRLPTPPPKVKRVFHRLQSPEPKIIERVYVRRPQPQIIENVIEVPPEKVRIINREKYLEKSAPVTRSKLVHLKSRHNHKGSEQQQYEENYIPSEQYSQQQATMVPSTTEQSPAKTTTLVYPPQSNMRTVGYIKSTVPPEVMFNSQQPMQISAPQTSDQSGIQSTPYDNPPQQTINHQTVQPSQQTTNYEMVQPTTYNFPSQQPFSYQMTQPTSFTYPSQQPVSYQMAQPTSFTYPSEQPVSYQMAQPTSFTYPSQQPVSYQMPQPTSFTYPSQQPVSYQMPQPTPFTYPSQTMMPNSPYGYTQFQ